MKLFNKIFVILTLLITCVSSPAVNWTNYPFGTPSPNDTFLFGSISANTNKQIRANNLIAYIQSFNILGLTTNLAFNRIFLNYTNGVLVSITDMPAPSFSYYSVGGDGSATGSRVEWTAINSTSVFISRSDGNDTSFGTETEYGISGQLSEGLNYSTTYYYRARGYNAVYGYGDYVTNSFSTEPAPPPASNFSGYQFYQAAYYTFDSGCTANVSGDMPGELSGTYTGNGAGLSNQKEGGYGGLSTDGSTWYFDAGPFSWAGVLTSSYDPANPNGTYSANSVVVSDFSGSPGYVGSVSEDRLSWSDNSGGSVTFYVVGPVGEIFRGTGSSCSTNPTGDGHYFLYAVTQSGDILIGDVVLRST